MEPAVLGFVVAVIVALTGVGGGAVMTPALVYLLDVPLATAIGTDLLYLVATKAIAMFSYSRAGQVQWDLARGLLKGSLPAAVVVLLIISYLGGTVDDSVYRPIVAVALIVTAIVLLTGHRSSEWLKGWVSLPPGLLLPVAGVMLGTLVSLSSIGAGALGVTAILLVAPAIAARQLVATDLAQAFPLALVAGVGHAMLGYVDAELLLYLLIGAVPGALLGCRLSGFVPRKLLAGTLGAILLMVSVSLVIS